MPEGALSNNMQRLDADAVIAKDVAVNGKVCRGAWNINASSAGMGGLRKLSCEAQSHSSMLFYVIDGTCRC